MSAPSFDNITGPIALVIQTRIADDGASTYLAWQKSVGQLLTSVPGFVDQQVVAPSPPAQLDWIVHQRFQSVEAARAWMQSDTLHSELSKITHLIVGQSDIFLRSDVTSEDVGVVANIACTVAPEHEAEFISWQEKVFLAEAKSPGFIGHRLLRPFPGIREDWVVVLRFDTEQNMNNWLKSPAREKLIQEGKNFSENVRVRTTSIGFDFWARPAAAAPPSSFWIFQTNLLVLLVLYPFIYLWGFLVSDPLVGPKQGLQFPFFVALFIANFVSTQALGFWIVPWAFKRFDAWLSPKGTQQQKMLGWVVLLICYGCLLALGNFVLNHAPLKYL